MPSAQCRAVCFTINNPESYALGLPDCVRYGVWQLEKVSTPHLQGYLEFKTSVTFAAIKKWLPTAHLEARKGTREQARAYCMKEESRIEGPWEHGEFSSSQGKRSDLCAVRDMLLSGAAKRAVLDEYPEVLAKYPRFVDTCIKMAASDSAVKVLELVPKFEWQANVLSLVASPPSDREILWVYDPVGNHGKTYLSKYLVDSKGAFYCNGGKSVDVSYSYSGQNIVVFDYVRDAADYVSYGVIEQIKNGILFSTKYESDVKRFSVPHVLVFANFRPAEDKFSQDRLCIIELNSVGEII